MANGYGSSSSSSSSSYSSGSARTTVSSVNNMSIIPPTTVVKQKVIKGIDIDLSNIKADGETRTFTIFATNESVFSLIILNNHNNYYNFDTKTFTTTPKSLNNIVIKGGTYKNTIVFPKLPDTNTDHYTLHLIASLKDNTIHSDYKEARYADGTIDFNSSKGSDSAVLIKKIYQHVDKTITLTAISPNALTAFSGTVPVTDTVTVAGNNAGKTISFTVTATAEVSRNFVVKKQPTINDVFAFVTRTIGSAGIAITGENTDSGSLFYKWPVDIIVGLKEGMFISKATNVTNGTKISEYRETVDEKVLEKQPNAKGVFEVSSKTKKSTIVLENAVQSTGVKTVTNGVVTSQPGNVVFNKQQAEALKDDTIKVFAYGRDGILSLSGYDVKFSNLKVELTAVTTTTTSSTVGSASTSVAIAERAGIRDKVSTVTGIGVDTSSAIPTVVSGAGAVSGAGTVVLSAAQELESGVTLTFGGASRIATITGDIEVLKAGPENLTLRIDLEKILTAT